MHVWIVEMLNGIRWEPTVGIGLTRDDALLECAKWRGRNPTDKFRVKKYVAI